MPLFSTEFPVKHSSDRSAFVAEVIAWLRGMDQQSVLDPSSQSELEDAFAHIKAKTGEELRMRELRGSSEWQAIGVRYDQPDNMGRIWRVECVLKSMSAGDEQDLVRLRAQCIAQSSEAKLETPKKPYLVKALLKSGWGGRDGDLHISDKPRWLDYNDTDLDLARRITSGESTRWLPVVYVAAAGTTRWQLDRERIEKLAYRLGGIAHVVVEPDRQFSFALREQTNAKNVYAGTVGLMVPNRGCVKKLYLGWHILTQSELSDAITNAAVAVKSQMPALGWGWTELQEQVLQEQRRREKNKLTSEESETLYLEEIENLKERIRELELLSANVNSYIDPQATDFGERDLVGLVGPEVYTGEIFDRLRYAAKTTLSFADQVGLDKRSTTVLKRVTERIPISPELKELLNELKQASKDKKRMAKSLTAVLCRHGFSEKSENKHIRLEPQHGFDGLESITVPKTPSESRGLKNQQKQIERALGISKLKS